MAGSHVEATLSNLALWLDKSVLSDLVLCSSR
ncbi:hypothetical protein PI124_g10556 [Phytophthora idaei]|nr:hypothetical protein PI125_g10136 [Phytophthora idaei]KAG3171105.1 hypothetical protein PI126_g2065 [Phytophthora idaei]KAG3244691.1 hypothetical protein PI124_g10556 [Phytophthora idaei]